MINNLWKHNNNILDKFYAIGTGLDSEPWSKFYTICIILTLKAIHCSTLEVIEVWKLSFHLNSCILRKLQSKSQAPGKHGAQKSKLTLKKPDLETSQDILLHLKNILCTYYRMPATYKKLRITNRGHSKSKWTKWGGWVVKNSQLLSTFMMKNVLVEVGMRSKKGKIMST